MPTDDAIGGSPCVILEFRPLFGLVDSQVAFKGILFFFYKRLFFDVVFLCVALFAGDNSFALARHRP